jgi:hypothetical protein
MRNDCRRARGVVQAALRQRRFVKSHVDDLSQSVACIRELPCLILSVHASSGTSPQVAAVRARASAAAAAAPAANKLPPRFLAQPVLIFKALRSQCERAPSNAQVLSQMQINLLRIIPQSRRADQCPVNCFPCKYIMLQFGSSMLTISTAFGPMAGQSRTSMATSLLCRQRVKAAERQGRGQQRATYLHRCARLQILWSVTLARPRT